MSLRLAIALFISVCAPSWLAAQSSDAPIRFDEASVKPHDQGDGRMGSGRRGRTYTVTNMPLRPIIAAAYRVQLQSSLLVGGPSWIGGNAPPWSGADRFDIVATLPDNATSQQVPEMLRALLAERFTLVVHTEVRELPAFALVAARGDKRLGPQLRPAAFDCEAAQAAGLAIRVAAVYVRSRRAGRRHHRPRAATELAGADADAIRRTNRRRQDRIERRFRFRAAVRRGDPRAH